VVEVQPLSQQHDRAAFDCGVPTLNDFLRQTARQHQEKGVSRTFVLVDPDSKSPREIIGYFALSACEAVTAALPANLAKRLPRTIPAVLLGRLAVHRAFQGQGHGSVLLVEAVRRVATTASLIGLAGLFVDAKGDAAATFYRKFGSVPLPDNPHRLFLPLDTLVQVANRIG
jgi:GNAT superfamily N-acetyltransferase